jgi:hypothetical protein
MSASTASSEHVRASSACDPVGVDEWQSLIAKVHVTVIVSAKDTQFRMVWLSKKKNGMVCLEPGYIMYASIAGVVYAVNYSVCVRLNSCSNWTSHVSIFFLLCNNYIIVSVIGCNAHMIYAHSGSSVYCVRSPF